MFLNFLLLHEFIEFIRYSYKVNSLPFEFFHKRNRKIKDKKSTKMKKKIQTTLYS